MLIYLMLNVPVISTGAKRRGEILIRLLNMQKEGLLEIS